MKKLTILTTSTCGRCKRIRPYLKEVCENKGIMLEELMIPDPAAMEVAKKYKATSAPFILYEDGVSVKPKEYRNIHDIADVDAMIKEII